MKAVMYFIVFIAALAALGIAGESDRVNQIIYTMPRDTYYEIFDSLSIHGQRPSDREIADFYMRNYDHARD